MLTFGQLHEQVTVTAEVLVAQGLDTDAAVGAILTAVLMRAGGDAAGVAARVPEEVTRVRESARSVVGHADLGSLAVYCGSWPPGTGPVAVVDTSGAALTYRELDARSDELAAACSGAVRAPGHWWVWVSTGAPN